MAVFVFHMFYLGLTFIAVETWNKAIILTDLCCWPDVFRARRTLPVSCQNCSCFLWWGNTEESEYFLLLYCFYLCLARKFNLKSLMPRLPAKRVVPRPARHNPAAITARPGWLWRRGSGGRRLVAGRRLAQPTARSRLPPVQSHIGTPLGRSQRYVKSRAGVQGGRPRRKGKWRTPPGSAANLPPC